MSRSWVVPMLLLLALCSRAVQAQELLPEAKQQLAAAGAAVGKAITTHDTAALEKLWSPKLLVNSPNNHVLTRAEVLDAIKRGQLEYEGGYTSRLEKVEFYGNVAVTMADETLVPGFGPDKGKTIRRRSTNVWQYGDGAWVMIARQATIYDPDAKHY
ncbi:protein of unknown function [Pseudoxanthomonas sp. GM95]|uniref:nuclear transport factor 2 family protein n=1 Tax=Pseudoxanthomonas sp. GM95 TaxID=1881043 RepID=UPI0008B3C00D|nr:nuclear transport factor 2 family protein [Pseudoxanthomonas sp. GM95]SEL68262.1 protein of unknown function [Pseudoxanthomonas sp. GM95]